MSEEMVFQLTKRTGAMIAPEKGWNCEARLHWAESIGTSWPPIIQIPDFLSFLRISLEDVTKPRYRNNSIDTHIEAKTLIHAKVRRVNDINGRAAVFVQEILGFGKPIIEKKVGNARALEETPWKAEEWPMIDWERQGLGQVFLASQQFYVEVVHFDDGKKAYWFGPCKHEASYKKVVDLQSQAAQGTSALVTSQNTYELVRDDYLEAQVLKTLKMELANQSAKQYKLIAELAFPHVDNHHAFLVRRKLQELARRGIADYACGWWRLAEKPSTPPEPVKEFYSDILGEPFKPSLTESVALVMKRHSTALSNWVDGVIESHPGKLRIEDCELQWHDAGDHSTIVFTHKGQPIAEAKMVTEKYVYTNQGRKHV